jgi:hypothetical protein
MQAKFGKLLQLQEIDYIKQEKNARISSRKTAETGGGGSNQGRGN